ncbi:SGNH/GDSL hydrolase family protein [Mycoplasma phocoenae]|uniref:SGNH hydrolase-type esterase domain-containing protein n=1 Tax=Mycoplasma phocoenae TaxID=754517 RepID=A0A858U8M5_9MOLU|nr:SGNH/GDSL hydrolase family protein [Mycoplasma phocoenae]QJG67088.1 hypothetical protein HGG69_02070 [Mycoplasma phocoenae]
MEKNKKIKIIVAASLAGLLLIGASVTAGLLVTKKTQDPVVPIEPEINQKRDESTIEGNVRYIAIGDSIGAGFNINFGTDQGGYFNTETKEVEGLSYPSYIAGMLKQANDSTTKLESFTNYSLTGTTLNDWIYLLNPSAFENEELQKVKRQLNFNKQNNKNSNQAITMYGENRISYLFNDFVPTENKFTHFIEELSKANLLTISLGANDFKDETGFINLLNLISSNKIEQKEELTKAYENIKVEGKKAIQNIVSKYKKLIELIRTVNKKININIISYPQPFLKLNPFLDSKFESVSKDITDELMAELNTALKQAASDNAVNFINSYDQELWEKHVQSLAQNPLDIHPSLLGYKKMAQDIFYKMAFDTYEKGKPIALSESFKLTDDKKYKQVIHLKDKKNDELRLFIYGVDELNVDVANNKYTFENSHINKTIIKLFTENKNVDVEKLLLDSINGDAENLNKNIIDRINRVLSYYSLSLEDLPSIQNVLEKLNKDENSALFLQKFAKTLIDTKIFSKLFNAISNDLDKLLDSKYAGAITKQDISKIAKNNLLNIDELYKALKSFMSSEFVKNQTNKKILKQISQALLNEFSNVDFFFKLLPNVFNEKFIGLKIEQTKLKLIIDSFIKINNKMIDNPSQYFNQAPNFNKFIKNIFDNDKEECKTILINLLKVFIENNDLLNKTISKALNNYNSKENKLNEQQIENIRYTVVTYISHMPNEEYFITLSENIIDSMFANINNKNIKFESILLPAVIKSITESYKGNEQNEFIIDLLSFGATDDKYKKGFDEILNIIFNHNFIKDFSATGTNPLTGIDTEKIKTWFINLLNSPIFAKNQYAKDNIKKIILLLLKSNVFKNPLIPQVLSTLSEGNVVNVIYQKMVDLKITDSISKEYEEYKNGLKGFIQDWFDSLILDLLNSEEIFTQLEKSISNVVDNLDKLSDNTVLGIVKKAVKNINILDIKGVLKSLVTTITKDGKTKEKSVKFLHSLLKGFFDIDLNKQQINLLVENISLVLLNAPDSQILSNIIGQVQKADTDSTNTVSEVVQAISKSIIDFVKSNNSLLINDILSLIVARDKNNKINVPIHKWLISLKPLMNNQKINKLIFEKFSIKNKLKQMLNDWKLWKDDFDQETQQSFEKIKSQLIQLIDNNLEDITNDIIIKLVEKIFSDESIKAAENSPSTWFEKYIMTNIANHLSEFINTITTELTTNNDFKDSTIKFAINLAVYYSKEYVSINKTQKDLLIKTITKLFDSILDKNTIKTIFTSLTDGLVKSIKLSNDVTVSEDFLQDFNKQFSTNKLMSQLLLIDFSAIFNKIDSEDIANIIDIIHTNKEKIVGLITKPSTEESKPTEKPEENESQFDIQIILKPLLKSFIPLVKKINNDTNNNQKMSQQIDEILEYLLVKEETKKLFKDKVKSMYDSIKDSIGIEKNKFDSMVDFVFDNVLTTKNTKELITGLLNSFIKDNNDEVQKVETIFDLIKLIIEKNKDKFVTYVKESVDKLLKDSTQQETVIDIIVNVIVKKTEAESIRSDIKDVLKLVINKLTETQIINNVLNSFINSFVNIKLENGNDLTTIDLNPMLSELKYQEFINSENIKPFFEALFKTNINDKLTNIIKFFLTKPSNNNNATISEEDAQSQEPGLKIDFLEIIKSFIDVLDKTADETILQNIADLVQKVAKVFVNNKLDLSSIKQISSASQTKLKTIIEKLIEDQNTKTAIVNILKSFFGNEELKSVKSIEELINELVKSNVDSVVNTLKVSVSETLKSKKQNDILDIIIEFITKQFNKEMDEDTQNSIKNMLKRVLNDFGNFKLLDIVIQELTDILKNTNILLKDFKFNEDIVKKLKEKFTLDHVLELVSSSQNITPVLEKILDADKADNTAVEEVTKLINWILKPNSTENTESNTDEKSSLFETIHKYAKQFNGVLANSNENLKTKIKLLVKNVLKQFIEKIDIESDTIDNNNVILIQKLINNVISLDSVDSLLNNTLIKILTKEIDLSKSKDFNETVKIILNTVKNSMGNDVKQVVNEIVTSQKDSIKEILKNIIEKYIDKKVSNQEENSINLLIDNILGLIKEDKVLAKVIKEILTNLSSVDFELDGKWNVNDIKKSIEKAFALDKIDSYITKDEMGLIINSLFKDINSVNALNDVYKLFRNKLLEMAFKDKEKTTENSNQNITPEPENKNNNLENIIISFIKKANGSLKTDDPAAKNFANWLSELFKDELINFNFNQLQINAPLTPNTLNEIMKSLSKSTVLFESISLIMSDFISVEDSKIQSATTLNEVVKELFKKNADKLSTSLVDVLKLALSDNDNEKLIANDLSEFLIKKYKLNFTKDSAETKTFIDIVSRFLNILPNADFVDKLLTDSIQQAVDIDILNAMQLDNEFFLTWINKILTNIDIEAIITNNIPAAIYKILIPNEELINNDDATNQKQIDKIFNLYKFIREIMQKRTSSSTEENTPNDSSLSLNKDSNKKLENLMLKLITTFNNSLNKDSDSKQYADQKSKIISESIIKIIKDLSKTVDFGKLLGISDSKSNNINTLIQQIAEYKEVSEFVSKLINDLLNSDYTKWKGHKQDSDKKLGNWIQLFIQHEKDYVEKFVLNVFNKFVNTADNSDKIAKTIFALMKVENTTKDEEKLMGDVIKRSLKTIVNTDWFQKKILKRTVYWLEKKAVEFDMSNPGKWVKDAMSKVTSVLGASDATILLQVITDDNESVIKPKEFVKLINVIFEKSNFEDSLVYNSLRKLNMDPDLKKRTNKDALNNITGENIFEALSKLKPSKPEIPKDEKAEWLVTPEGSITTILKTGFALLSKAYYEEKINESSSAFKQRRQKESYKAIYRFMTAVDFVVFEMFFRETNIKDREKDGLVGMLTSNSAIYWVIQEDKAYSVPVNIGLGKLLKNAKIRNEFHSYYNSHKWYKGYSYANESNYKPDNVLYILTTSGFNKNDKSAKGISTDVNFYINNKKLSKREYVLKTIQNGGWAEFMNKSGKTSNNDFSGLNKIKSGQY